jgi:hypothetical protein
MTPASSDGYAKGLARSTTGQDVWRRILRVPRGLQGATVAGRIPLRNRGPVKGWSGRRGSNSRHSAWKADALPTELLPPGSAPRGYSTWARAQDPALWSRGRVRTSGAGPCRGSGRRSLVKLSNLLVVAAVIGAVFGVGFVVASGPLLAIYGITLDKAGTLVAQLFGAALISLARAELVGPERHRSGSAACGSAREPCR